MTSVFVFFAFASIALVFAAFGFVNFFKMMKNPSDMFDGGVARHVILFGLAGVSFLGAVISGIVWIVNQFAA